MSDDRFKSTAYITGLRGYSAMAVLLRHAGLWLSWSPLPLLAAFGHNGVVSFFLISALTIGMSLRRAASKGGVDYGEYLLRRFFRIAPLYFAACLVAWLTGGDPNGGKYYRGLYGVPELDVTNLLVHLSFLNMFWSKYKNTLVGVEWTIAVEFLWYLVLPFLFLVGKARRASLYLLLWPALLFTYHPYFFIEKIYRAAGAAPFPMEHWQPQAYALTYVLGLLIEARLASREKPRWYEAPAALLFGLTLVVMIPNNEFRLFAGLLLAVLVVQLASSLKTFTGPLRLIQENAPLVALLGIFTAFLHGSQPRDTLFTMLWIALLVRECARRGWLARMLFENRVVHHLGEISYSLYLLHFLALPLWKMLGLPTAGPVGYFGGLLFTIGLSTLTYRFIEKPFMALGGRIAAGRTRLAAARIS